MPGIKSKRWCFTLNNYTEDELQTLHTLVETNSSVSLVLFGLEIAPTTGTPHIQGYIEIKDRKGIRYVKSLISRRVNVRKADGTYEQNKAYCSKNNDFYEYGVPIPTRGARTDLTTVKELIEQGTPEKDIADQYFGIWARYHKSFQRYRALLNSSTRTSPTETTVYWGSTGTGKTRMVYAQCAGVPIFTPGDYEWFDGYENHEVVLFDDYRGEYPIQFLLKLLDRYPMNVKVKGSFVTWNPKRVFITSNITPREWYPNADNETWCALRRRLTNIIQVDKPLFDDIVIPTNDIDLSDFLAQ